MTYEVATRAVDTILILPTTAASIAERCREAALEFMNESKHWGKAELGTWLTASYAALTTRAKNVHIAPDAATVPLMREIDTRLVDRIMAGARTEILEALQAIAANGSASFVLRALIAGSVVRCEDVASVPTWVPTSGPARLADRVLSLFAVDYLARAGDYEAGLVVCHRCESITFAAPAGQACLRCSRPSRRHSLLAPRHRHTLPYPPLGA